MHTSMSLFKNAFRQRCYKIEMTPLLRMHSCSLFFLSIVCDCFPLLFTDIFKEGIWKETETFKDPHL